MARLSVYHVRATEQDSFEELQFLMDIIVPMKKCSSLFIHLNLMSYGCAKHRLLMVAFLFFLFKASMSLNQVSQIDQ